MLHHPFHQKVWYKQGVIYLTLSHLEDLCNTWYYQRKKVEKQIKIIMLKRNYKDENSMFLNIKSKSKAWITKIAHHNVSLRSSSKIRDRGRKAGGDANIIHRICCPFGLFHPCDLLLSHLHYNFWKKKIVTLSRVIGIIMREFYTQKFGFEVLGDNIKVFYKQGWHYWG